jgi:AraC-like DNA-binding protein
MRGHDEVTLLRNSGPPELLDIGNVFEVTKHLGLRLQAFRYATGIGYPAHTHEEASIVICTRGVLESTQFGARTLLSPGEVLITNRNTLHASRYCVDGGVCEGLTIDLDSAACEKVLAADERLTHSNPHRVRLLGVLPSPKAARMAADLRDEILAMRPGREFLIESTAVQICIEVLRSWPRALVGYHGTPDARTGLLPRWQFIRTIEYMYAIGKGEVAWERIGERLHRNPGDLAREFEESTGCSLEECVNSVRISRARKLLEGSARTRASVAQELGFRNYAEFLRTFRRYGGE